MLNIDKNIYMLIKSVIASLVILFGLFWIIKKPASRTYGKKIIYKDIIVGVISIFIGMLLLFCLKY